MAWAIHLYIGEDQSTYVHGVYCGWPRAVHRRHTTWDWREVTCVNCLGRRAGLAALALKQPETTAPHGPDGDSRDLDKG